MGSLVGLGRLLGELRCGGTAEADATVSGVVLRREGFASGGLLRSAVSVASMAVAAARVGVGGLERLQCEVRGAGRASTSESVPSPGAVRVAEDVGGE